MASHSDDEIKAWLSECQKLVIDHVRRQGFPIDDYRVELTLTDQAAVPLWTGRPGMDIPPHIIEAARTLKSWGEANELDDWTVYGIGPRDPA